MAGPRRKTYRLSDKVMLCARECEGQLAVYTDSKQNILAKYVTEKY